MEAETPCGCCVLRAADKDLRMPYTRRGAQEVYSQLLQECFGIQVMDECGICECCVARLQDASDFKLQVQRSQEELQARVQGALLVKDEEPSLEAEGRCVDSASGTEFDIVVKSEAVNEDGSSNTMLDGALGTETVTEDGTTDDRDSMSHIMCDTGLEPELYISARAKEQLAMACVVRLERLRGDEAPLAGQTCPATSHHEPGQASPMQDTYVHTAPDCAEEQGYTCDNCREQFTYKFSLIRHIFQTDECKNPFVKYTQTHIDIKIYCCDMCRKKFTSKSILIRHIKRYMRRNPALCEVNNQTNIKSSKLNKRKIRRALNSQNRNINMHIAKNKKFTLNECHKQIGHKSKKLFVYVHERINSGIKPYECKECNKQFTQKHNLISHERIHSGVKPYACKDCDKQFTHKSGLVIHERIHSGVKPYACKDCDKQFTQKSNLVIHERIHSGVKPYACKDCDKQFIQRKHLVVHERTHSRVKPYSCEDCNKSFSDPGYFSKHRKLHTGEIPYECKICHKRFKQMDHLKRHEITHLEVKPFNCKECSMQFAVKCNLDRHEKTHSAVKLKAVSKKRNKRSPRKDNLNVHRKSYIGVNPHICLECNKNFSQKRSLVHHLKTKHDHVESNKHFYKESSVDTQKIILDSVKHICEECKNWFSSGSELERHKRIHTGDKSYECEICESIFFDEASLITHVETHRARTKSP